MKEITRIHIAKISYDIEIEAKKELEAYLRTLESFSGDTDIVDDVEIRITEILAERGIQKDSVIGKADIEALKAQLGEPSEFAADGEKTTTEEVSVEQPRKLYRDTDNAVLGGVLSGAAAFFKINPLWVRLIFIIIALASFGTALLVYVVLWIAVPPARTAADKLQMSGRPVTVDSIREINENDTSRPASNGGGRKVLLVLGGVISLFLAIGSAVATAVVGVMALTGKPIDALGDMPGSEYFIVAFYLALASGILFTALMSLTTYAAFSGKATKRTLVSGAVIIGLGLLTFCGAAATAQYGAFVRNQEVRENTRETAVSLPSDTKAAKGLVVDAEGVEVEYVAVSTDPKATLRTVTADPAESHSVSITQDGDSLKITAKKPQNEACKADWCWWNMQTKVMVYGPAVDAITVAADSRLSYTASNQANLTLTAERGAHANIAGSIESLRAVVREDASVSASDAAINKVETTLDMSAQLSLATIQTLVVSGQNACASNLREARISVERITDANVMINGQSHPAESMDSGCLEVEIEDRNRR
ncbi:MAG TPA: PspC domain-containing protein [Candidatus Saccharimonadales bacterium]